MKTEPRYPSANQIARLVVAVSAQTDEDPIAIVTNPKNSRGRAYVFAAIRREFPWLRLKVVARMLGGGTVESKFTFLRTAPTMGWWDDALFEAIAGPGGSEPEDPVLVWPKAHLSVTSFIMGDPVPGRSALDQRASAGR